MQTITHSTRATEEQIGEVAFNREDDEVYVCTRCYGYPSWTLLGGLSSANWMRHRDEIADAMAADKKDSIKKETKNKANIKYMEEGKTTEVMLIELYEKLAPEEKKTFLNSHKKSWLFSNICTVCLETCDGKTKCIHSGCGGMCKSCFDSFTAIEDPAKKCPCCGETQKKICPICQEEKTDDQLCASEGPCSHSVCYKCFTMAYKAGRPIITCPLCRGPFAKSLGGGGGFASDTSDDEDEDEEWEEPNYDEELVDMQLQHAAFLQIGNNGVPQEPLHLTDAELANLFGVLRVPAQQELLLRHQLSNQ